MTDVVIFAAGLGSRLGLGVPKCLVHVSGKPILQYQLDAINSALNQCIIHVITGYCYKQVEMFLAGYKGRNRIITHRNPFFKEAGICGSAWIASQFIMSQSVLRLDGDVIISADSLKKLMKQNTSTLLTADCFYGKKTNVVKLDKESFVQSISLEENYSGTDEWICVELYCNGEYVPLVEDAIDTLPRNAHYYEALNLYFQKGIRFSVLHANHVYEIDTPEDLKMTEAELAYAAKN